MELQSKENTEEMGLILGIVYRIEGAEEPPKRRKLFES